MKRVAWFIAFLLPTITATAATIVVDPQCGVAGNGTGGYTATCDASANGNPAASFSVAIGAAVAGDFIEFRGIHSAHDTSCSGSTTGVYGNLDQNQINDVNPASVITIRPYQYTGPGTGETVYFEATSTPGAFTQCAWDGLACDCGASTQNVDIGGGGSSACAQTWYLTGLGTGNFQKVIGIELEDGSPGFRVSAHTNMTNATAGYNGNRCSTSTWIRCNSGQTGDCPGSETCTSSRAEVDTYSAQTSATDLLVRYGSDPTSQVKIYNDPNGYGFHIRRSSKITFTGLIFRNFRRNAFNIGDPADSAGAAHDIIISDCRMYYFADTAGNGSDHAVVVTNSTAVTINASTMRYSGSELIHTEAKSDDSATVYTIQTNWLQDVGDQNVLGGAVFGTPSFVILGEIGGGPGAGNYAGSDFSGNYMAYSRRQTTGSGGALRTSPRGIVTENNSHDWVIHDNVEWRNGGTCFRMEADGTYAGGAKADNNTVYNNLFVECGYSGQGGEDLVMTWIAAAGKSMSSINIFNNTAYGMAGGFLDTTGADAATLQNNTIANNVAQSSGNPQLVNWTDVDTGNSFDHNDMFTSNNPAIKWQNTTYTCAAIGTAGTGNICSDPKFNSTASLNFHILTGSPAKNSGTTRCSSPYSCGTTDINNTVASAHGFPSYADANTIQGGTWDMGADEFLSTSTTKVMVVSRLWQVSACAAPR